MGLFTRPVKATAAERKTALVCPTFAKALSLPSLLLSLSLNPSDASMMRIEVPAATRSTVCTPEGSQDAAVGSLAWCWRWALAIVTSCPPASPPTRGGGSSGCAGCPTALVRPVSPKGSQAAGWLVLRRASVWVQRRHRQAHRICLRCCSK